MHNRTSTAGNISRSEYFLNEQKQDAKLGIRVMNLCDVKLDNQMMSV